MSACPLAARNESTPALTGKGRQSRVSANWIPSLHGHPGHRVADNPGGGQQNRRQRTDDQALRSGRASSWRCGAGPYRVEGDEAGLADRAGGARPVGGRTAASGARTSFHRRSGTYFRNPQATGCVPAHGRWGPQRRGAQPAVPVDPSTGCCADRRTGCPPGDRVSPPPTLETRLTAVETGLRSLISIVGTVSAGSDDARAARTVSLIEKSVTEDVRAAYLAQQDATDAETRARAALQQVVDHTRASSEARARAAAALGRAFDGRSRQLDQLLTPGSAATLDEPQPGS